MVLTVEVTATNIAGSASALSAPVTITNPLPVPTTWISRSAGTTQGLTALASSGVELVVLGNSTIKDMRRSLDGISWSAVAGHGVGGGVADMIFGGGKFVATAGGTDAAGKIKTSIDGLSWASATHPVIGSDNVYGTAYGAGVYAAVVSTGSFRSLRSTDSAATFANASTPITFNPTCIAYGNGVFVAGGLSGEVATSPDGNVWTNGTSAITVRANKVRFGGGLFMMVGQGGQIATSPDGLVWTRRDVPGVTTAWSSVAYNNGVWLVVGSGANGRYSTDNGASWVVTSVSGVAVSYISNRWVVTGPGGGVFTSDY